MGQFSIELSNNSICPKLDINLFSVLNKRFAHSPSNYMFLSSLCFLLDFKRFSFTIFMGGHSVLCVMFFATVLIIIL